MNWKEKDFSALQLWQLFAYTPLDKSEAFQVMTAFAHALGELHQRGELWDHCENGVEILVDGSIRIGGTISNRSLRLLDSAVDPYRSIAPPEYIRSGVHNERSDIFAWGIVSYELVTGECPVKGDTLVETLESATKCEFASPTLLRPDWPEWLSEVISKSLRKEPEQRYSSADELLLALRTVDI